MMTRWISASMILALVAVAPAMAAKGASQLSPAPPQSHWVGMAIAVLLFVGVCVSSFMSARRTHQD